MTEQGVPSDPIISYSSTFHIINQNKDGCEVDDDKMSLFNSHRSIHYQNTDLGEFSNVRQDPVTAKFWRGTKLSCNPPPHNPGQYLLLCFFSCVTIWNYLEIKHNSEQQYTALDTKESVHKWAFLLSFVCRGSLAPHRFHKD